MTNSSPKYTDADYFTKSEKLAGGSHVVQRPCTFANIAMEAAKFAINKDLKNPSSVAVLSVKTPSLYGGNSITNVNMIEFGIKELYAILCHSSLENSDRLKRILNSVRANIATIKILENANADSFKVVNLHISQIHCGQGKHNVVKQRSEDLCKEANELFNQAYAALAMSCSNSEQVSVLLDSNIRSNERLALLATKERQKCTENFISIINAINRKSLKIKVLLNICFQSNNRCVAFLLKGCAKQKKAHALTTSAADAARHVLDMIIEKNHDDHICEARLNVLQDELVEIRIRNEYCNRLIEQVSEDLTAIQRLSTASHEKTSMVQENLGGSLSGKFRNDPVSVLIEMKKGAGFVHKRSYIFLILKKVYEFVFGKKGPDFMPAVIVSPLLSYHFNARLNGMWNYSKRRQSWTHGKIQVTIGKTTYSVSFDLNEKRNRIGEKDIMKLSKALKEALKSKAISYVECRDIMYGLETILVNRGPEHSKPIAGFVQRDSPFFGELRIICNKLEKGLPVF